MPGEAEMSIVDISPYARKMGFEVNREDDGRIILSMPEGKAKRGRPGFIHGGAIAGLMETVALVTLADALGAENRARMKPINFTATYMRGATEQMTYARAVIERLGKRTANVEAIAWQDDPDRPVATAQINFLITSPPN